MFHNKLLLFVSIIALPLSAYAWDEPPVPTSMPTITVSPAQHQGQRQQQRQSQNQSTNTNTNVKVVNVQSSGGSRRSGSGVGNGGAGNGSVPVVQQPSNVFAAPSWSLPSIGASGNDCPTVGISGGGSGPFGGGGIGPSWLSTDCNARKLAQQLQEFGYPDQALILLRHHFPEVDEAFKQAADTANSSNAAPPPKPMAATLTGVEGADSFCVTASASERRRYRDICGK